MIQCNNTVLLACATMSKQPKEGIDFLPLTIEYQEKMYAAGKIPGGFFKREAKPRTEAILTSRLIDRPLRPSFPKNMHHEIQIVVTILSYDESVSPDHLAIIAASSALTVSDIPFNGPIGAALVCLKDGEYIVNPDIETEKNADLAIMVAGNKDSILMVEAGANEVTEEQVIEAIKIGHDSIKQTIELQLELQQQAGKEKITLAEATENTELINQINAFLANKVESTFNLDKQGLSDELAAIEESVYETFVTEEADNKSEVQGIFNSLKKEKIRKKIIQDKSRPDGRKTDEIRPIEIDTNILPSVHGSSLFTRGETQSLGVVTLGTSDDEQIDDGLADSAKRSYFFHYNFPPYSVGEVGRVGFTSRRELGHGALAERALTAVIPNKEMFPYTIRIVSEILESNGSSSMASVCSGSLSLMQAGVPVKGAVSGIAMGLLLDENGYTILSDIQGLEDHYGDMDFKVAGTEKGITALQLDIKVSGLSEQILTEALAQAKSGRLSILNKMNETIDAPSDSLAETAPKIKFLKINPDKVGMVIGSGGKMIKQIEEDSQAHVIITNGDTGEVQISSSDQACIDRAADIITALVKDIESGDIFDGKVSKITTFGAFIELVPGKDGLLHISKIAKEKVNKVEDYLTVGEKIKVKVNNIDHQNRINLVRHSD